MAKPRISKKQSADSERLIEMIRNMPEGNQKKTMILLITGYMDGFLGRKTYRQV